jgi:hypothetical protein
MRDDEEIERLKEESRRIASGQQARPQQAQRPNRVDEYASDFFRSKLFRYTLFGFIFLVCICPTLAILLPLIGIPLTGLFTNLLGW